MHAFAHADEPAYATWGHAHTCWAMLAPAWAPYNVAGGVRWLFTGGGTRLPDMPQSWCDYSVDITRHTLAAAVDAMLGEPPVAVNFEVLREPPESLVASVCGSQPFKTAPSAAASSETVVVPLDALSSLPTVTVTDAPAALHALRLLGLARGLFRG